MKKLNNFKIPFYGRSHYYNKKELKTLTNVVANHIPLTQNKYLLEFEEKFIKYTKCKFAFAVNSATSALELAAQLCLFKKNDEIICPAHTYTSSVYPFIKKGAKIIWSDIDLKTRVINLEQIKKRCTKKTKAILVTHLYGYCANIDEISKYAKEKKIILIEDCAQSIGSFLNSQHCGTFGDIGIFSFHSHKNMTTLGEGGMIVTKNKSFANIIPQLRHNGHMKFRNQKKYWLPAMSNVVLPTLNNTPLFPNNFTIGETSCVIGKLLLERIDEINKLKRNRAIKIFEELKEFDFLEFHKVKSLRHNYHLLVARLKLKNKRDIFINKMVNDKKIQCVTQYYPLYRYDFYKRMKIKKQNCPNTDKFYDNMISFPFNHLLTNNQIEYLTQSIKQVAKNI